MRQSSDIRMQVIEVAGQQILTKDHPTGRAQADQ
jgi:hypothetical protein